MTLPAFAANIAGIDSGSPSKTLPALSESFDQLRKLIFFLILFSSGTFADYFSTGVNTGNGLSMLLIPRGEGVETKIIKTSYSSAAGTAYISFDNVKGEFPMSDPILNAKQD